MAVGDLPAMPVKCRCTPAEQRPFFSVALPGFVGLRSRRRGQSALALKWPEGGGVSGVV